LLIEISLKKCSVFNAILFTYIQCMTFACDVQTLQFCPRNSFPIADWSPGGSTIYPRAVEKCQKYQTLRSFELIFEISYHIGTVRISPPEDNDSFNNPSKTQLSQHPAQLVDQPVRLPPSHDQTCVAPALSWKDSGMVILFTRLDIDLTARSR